MRNSTVSTYFSARRDIMKKTIYYRILFYAAGLLLLALGLTLNTKAGLGVSAIISVSYSISLIFSYNFGNTTLALYGCFVVIQLFLHLYQMTRRRDSSSDLTAAPASAKGKYILLSDLLQFPLSIVFTRFLNIFSAVLPSIPEDDTSLPAIVFRVILLLFAITFTGAGAAMSLNMRLIPNPGDGIVQAISDTIHKSVGFTKNCFDLFNIALAVTISFLFAGHPEGVGIGTVLAVIGVGRVISFFNHFAYEKMRVLAGME